MSSSVSLLSFHSLEERTDKVERLTRSASKGSSLVWFRFLAVYPSIRSLAGNQHEMNVSLATAYEPGSETETREMLARLRRVQSRFVEWRAVFASSHLLSKWPYASAIRKLEEEHEYLESIIEGFHLSLDQDFRNMVTETAADVRSAMEHSDCRPAQ